MNHILRDCAAMLRADAMELRGGVGVEITTSAVRRHLAEPGPHRFILESSGGSAADGRAIHEALSAAPVAVHVERLAASSAVPILLGATWRTMEPNARLMIHRFSIVAVGHASDLLRVASRLAAEEREGFELIAARTHLTLEGIDQALGEHGELWLDADDALRLGFVDAVVPAGPRAALPSKDERDRLLFHEHLLRSKLAELTDNTRMQAARETRAIVVERSPESQAEAERYRAEVDAACAVDSHGALMAAEEYLRRRVEAVKQSLAHVRRQVRALDEGRAIACAPETFWTCPDCGDRNYQPPGRVLNPARCHCKRN